MNRMKRIIFAAAMCILLCAMFAGCNENGDGPSDDLDITIGDPGGGDASVNIGDAGGDVSSPVASNYVPMDAPNFTVLSTEDGPLEPGFVDYRMSCWLNQRIFDGNGFLWEEYDDGSGGLCLMVLVDTNGGAGVNNELYVPGYGIPEVSNNGDWIYMVWTHQTDPDKRISLLFEDGGKFMAIEENAPKGVVQGPESDAVTLPVKVSKSESGQGSYFVPLYAILNEVGGGALCDPFGEGDMFIYTGGALQGYAGFWEVSDTEAEYRVDAVVNGQTISIANYWWALTLGSDGTFTEYNQHYQDEGSWIKNEFDGKYAFFGRILALRYLTENEYRGSEFNNLEVVKMDEPYVGWGGPDLSVGYVDEWDPADVLSISGQRILYSHELSGRQW